MGTVHWATWPHKIHTFANDHTFERQTCPGKTHNYSQLDQGIYPNTYGISRNIKQLETPNGVFISILYLVMRIQAFSDVRDNL